MGFTIICNKCGNKEIKTDTGNQLDLDGIHIGVTEDCGYQGCTVESIDIECWKCDNEINI